MATLQEQIAEKFLQKLASAGDVDADKIARLRELLARKKKIKPDDCFGLFPRGFFSIL